MNSPISKEDGFGTSSLNWLLHARYVRGEHPLCLDLVDHLQKRCDNKHIYGHYIKGCVLADAGRLQEALERFHSCIRLYPQDPEPLKQVSKCLFRQGRYQLALEAYKEADKLSRHPDPEIYCALAECSWSVGDMDRGVEWARSAIQAGGGERAGGLLAKLLLAKDDLHGALGAYDEALSHHACSADTLAAAGALRLRAGDPRGAFQLLGAALSQQPTQHAAALALAAMMLQHKDLDAALTRLKAALASHPECVAAHANLGLALLGKNKYVAALTCLQRAVWAAPLSARAAHNLGLALLLCKRPTSAFCRLATAASLQPYQPYTVLLIGIALERLGDSRADAAYSRAVSLADDDPLIRLNVAGRHARAGRWTEALQDARVTAELLQREEKPDAQLASSLASLLALLRDAGVELSQLPDAVPADIPLPTTVEEKAVEDHLAPDEIECKERAASLVVLPPLVLGYEELYDQSQDNIQGETLGFKEKTSDAPTPEVIAPSVDDIPNIVTDIDDDLDDAASKPKKEDPSKLDQGEPQKPGDIVPKDPKDDAVASGMLRLLKSMLRLEMSKQNKARRSK